MLDRVLNAVTIVAALSLVFTICTQCYASWLSWDTLPSISQLLTPPFAMLGSSTLFAVPLVANYRRYGVFRLWNPSRHSRRWVDTFPPA